MKLSRGALAHILLVLTVMVWGATFVVVQSALRDSSPAVFNLCRMVLAALVLVAMFPREIPRITRRQLVGGITVGACLAIGYAFQTTGLLYTTPSRSAFITGTVVVLVPLLSVFPFLRATRTSQPTWAAVAGAIVAFAGLAFLTTPPGTPISGILHGVNRGDWLTLGCAFGFALHLLSIARTSRFTDFRRLALLQTSAGSVFLALLLPFSGPLRLHVTPGWLVAVVVTAVFATSLAFLVQSWAQSFLPATHAALIFTLEPVFAAVTSFLVIGERLGARGFGGAALVLCGIAITEFLSPKAEEGTAEA